MSRIAIYRHDGIIELLKKPVKGCIVLLVLWHDVVCNTPLSYLELFIVE